MNASAKNGKGGPAGPPESAGDVAPELLYELKDISRLYGERVVLRVESLALRSGRVYGVAGPNGAGKTTLLEILAFLQAATSGTLRYRGEAVAGLRGSLRREVTLVLQNPVMLPGTVMDNVLFGLRARGVDKREARRSALAALKTVQLEELSGRRAGSLSGGEIQRVAVARALALEPRVLLLDEPFANVDAESVRLISAVLPQLARRPGENMVVFSCHEPGLAYGAADELLTLISGTLHPGGTGNIYSGELVDEGELKLFHPLVSVAAGAPGEMPRFRVVTGRRGRAKVLIPPEAVILSREPLDSSARNVLWGRVTSITEEKGVLRVAVDTGVPIAAILTHGSVERLALRPGTEVYASFKATAVRVF